jgi:hypothetical protein
VSVCKREESPDAINGKEDRLEVKGGVLEGEEAKVLK